MINSWDIFLWRDWCLYEHIVLHWMWWFGKLEIRNIESWEIKWIDDFWEKIHTKDILDRKLFIKKAPRYIKILWFNYVA